MNKTQTIVADLMKASSFNSFDGEQVVKILEENSNLWEGFIWGRFEGCSELIPLRDIAHNTYNADTMYLVSPTVEDAQILMGILRKKTHVDELDIIDQSKVGSMMGSYPYTKTLIRAWWD